MNFKKPISAFAMAFLPFLFFIKSAQAHCPLCTVGAIAAAGGAAWLGVSTVVIGVFIGAFAVSIGWWISRVLKKKYIPFQRSALIGLSFITTIVPMIPLMDGITPIYIQLIGGYGTLLNRTYVLNLFLLGSIIGGLIVAMSPWLSSKLMLYHGKKIPYHGIMLTFALLILASAVLELVL